MLSPFFLIALFILTAVNYFLLKFCRVWDYKNRYKWIPIDRKLDYINNKSGNFEQAKEIRLYGMSSWFTSLFDIILGKRKKWFIKSERAAFSVDALCASFTYLICDGGAYALLIYHMITKNLPVSDFVLYFGVISMFSNWLFGVANNFNSINAVSLSFCDLREFLDMPDRFNRGSGIAIPRETSTISFKNVCFRYPGCENDTIKNISFEIKKERRSRLPGLTALVKLPL